MIFFHAVVAIVVLYLIREGWQAIQVALYNKSIKIRKK